MKVGKELIKEDILNMEKGTKFIIDDFMFNHRYIFKKGNENCYDDSSNNSEERLNADIITIQNLIYDILTNSNQYRVYEYLE